MRGCARRPRRARRDAHGRGKSLCYQLPGAHARRPHDRRLAARLADAGPGRGAGAARAGHGGARQRAAGRRRRTAPRSTRAAAGELRLLYVAPERFSSPGFLERDPRGPGRAVRRRRGALRLAVGPRLPARLLPPRGRRALARGRLDHGLDRDGHAAGRLRHRRRGSGSRRRRASPPASTGRTSRSRSCRAGRPPTSARGSPPRWREPGARRRSSMRARARAPRRWPSALAGALGLEVVAYHAGLGREAARARRSGASWPARSRSSWRRTRSGWASTRRTCGRSPTRRCRGRSRPSTRRPAARAATGGRLGPCCSPRARQGPARLLHRARRGRRRRDRPRGARDRGGGRRRSLRPARVEGRRATIPTACEPSSATSRGRASCSRRRAPVDRAARAHPGVVRRPGAGGVPLRRPGGAARPLAAVPLRVGLRRGGALCRREDPAPLRRPPRSPSPACRAVTSARPSSCPPRPSARSARSGGGGPPPGDLDDAIVALVAGAEPVGGADAGGRDPPRRALEGRREVRLRRAAGLRDVRAPARRRGPLARRRAARRRDACESTGGAYPKLRVASARAA